MTKYKALMSIVVVAVVAVATITWSPLIADARWVAQEGEAAKLPATIPAANFDAAGVDECMVIPETALVSVGFNENDNNPISGKINVQDTGGTDSPEFHVIWIWCWTTVCKWIYTPDDGWHKVCYDKKIKCYIDHEH